MTRRGPMKRRDWFKTAAGAAFAAAAFGAEEIPPHPSQLEFPQLEFEPPDQAEFRRELPGGAVAYMVEDHQLPLVSVSMMLPTGDYLETDDQLGLAGFTGNQMRAGGTTTISAREFDEEAAFLASDIGSSIGDTSGGASLNSLAQNLPRSLELFFDMLKNPGFDPQRLELARAQTLQGMERRNDRTQGIAGREFGRLMRGDHFTARQSTQATIEAITPEAMREFHAKYYNPSRFLFAVSGDFDSDEMVERLGEFLTADGWPQGVAEVPPIPAPTHVPTPGVFMVHKDDPNLNQANVQIGHPGIARSNPDHIAVSVMNYILGGGGFTSRIMQRVRSDEGLAYSAGSSFPAGTYYPIPFTASFQSENGRSAQAATIVLEEMRRIREEKVSAQDIEVSQNYNIEIFPRFFATAGQVAGTFASDEFTGREEGYWKNYRDRIAAVNADEVLRVAQKYLKPDQATILAVGNTDEIKAGNPEKPEFNFDKLDPDGDITMIPLPDPMTMKYPEG